MKIKDILMYVLGGLITLCFFGLLAMLVLYKIPPENKELLTLAIGSLLSSFTLVVGYYYGSSRGSADKTEMLNTKI